MLFRSHEVVRDELVQFWIPRLPSDVRITPETQFNLDAENYTHPDVLVRPAAIKAPDVRGDAALLVVEIAESSLDFDQGTKAEIYARFGVREYWVINARTLETHIHTEPTASGYASIRTAPASETIAPTLVPALSVRLDELDLT